MNRKLLIALLLLGVIAYFFITQDSEEPADDGGSTWESFLLGLLERLAIMMGTDFVIRKLYTFVKDKIKKLKERGVKTTAEKEALKEAEKTAEELAEKEAMREAEREAERLEQEELERLAKKEATDLTEDEAKRLSELEAKKEAERVAKEEAEKLAREEAEKLAKEEAEKLAREEAERIAEHLAEATALNYLEKMGQEKLLAKTAEELAEKGLAKVGTAGAERVVLKTAVKVGESIFSKLAKMSGGPFEWLSFILSQTLVLALGLDSSMWEECPSDEWSFTHLPQEVLMVIQAIPFLGDAWSLIAELLCFNVGKCPEGKERSNTGVSCYDKCKDGFKSDGEAMCYKQYPGFEDRTFPKAPTVTSITLDVRTNTGKPKTGCPAGQYNDNGLCRLPCRAGYHAVGPLCWADSYTNPSIVGFMPWKKNCNEMARENGWIESHMRDDGTSCWEDWWISDGRGQGRIKATLFARQYCPSGSSMQPGGRLCTEDCKPGFHHPPGLPNQCYADGPASYENGAGEFPSCPAGTTEDSLGLCYDAPPPGFHKTTLGMMSEECPAGSTYFGVGCTRESYPRPLPQMAFDVHLKKRHTFYGIDPSKLPPGF